MGKQNLANLKKACYYFKRNGLRQTWYAVRERMAQQKEEAYEYIPPAAEELARQAEEAGQMEKQPLFSIVVPAYHTPEKYFRELVDSMKAQTYPNWELVVADSSRDGKLDTFLREMMEEENLKERIRYIYLIKNEGIAVNTNQGITHARGEYIGLLDHDDVLTPDALYEMAQAIEKGRKEGIEIRMLYSDEDKCDSERKRYYEPNRKEDFNLDLLLSNNYICHFLVMEEKLIKNLRLRREYNGAQDYDLVLRAAAKLLEDTRQIAHIPKVLYHWRCHPGSTAENPKSKRYAYTAGQRALQDFADSRGWKTVAEPLRHLGFYRLRYEGGILQNRKEIGAVGGRVLVQGKTAGGRMTAEGKLFYKDLPAGYSGYLHRAVLSQTAEALDIRCIAVRKECHELFCQITGVAYQAIPAKEAEGEIFDSSLLPEGTDYIQVSLALSKALREQGYQLLYQPCV